MAGPKLDIRATALANGYSEGQAATLASWKENDVIKFMADVIRPDGKKPILVWEGSYHKY